MTDPQLLSTDQPGADSLYRKKLFMGGWTGYGLGLAVFSWGRGEGGSRAIRYGGNGGSLRGGKSLSSPRLDHLDIFSSASFADL